MPDLTFTGTATAATSGAVVPFAKIEVRLGGPDGTVVTDVRRADGTAYPAGLAACDAFGRYELVTTGAYGDDFYGQIVDPPSVTDPWHLGIAQEVADALDGTVPASSVGTAGGPAGPLDATSRIPDTQIPPLPYLPSSMRGNADGVAPLGADALVPPQHLPLEVDYALRAEVPSLEETFFCTPLLWGDGAGVLSATAASGGLPLAPFPLRLLSLALTFTITIPASAVDYWTLTLKKTGSIDIVSRDTQTSQISPRVEWNYNLQSWAAARDLAVGEVVWITATKTGAPPPLTAGYATIRYARI